MSVKKVEGGPSGPYPIKMETLQWAKVSKDEYAGGLVQLGYAGDAGFDLCAARTVTVLPGSMAQIPTNVKLAIPEGYWAMIVGRSSTFFKRRLLVQSAIIDNGYRGELWCVVQNMSPNPVIVHRKDRVCQLLLFELNVPSVTEVAELPPSQRGDKGFGSTGVEEVGE